MDVVPDVSIDDLWRTHADELLRFATVLAGPHDAYDIVADAMLGAAASAGAPTRHESPGVSVPGCGQPRLRRAPQPQAAMAP